MKNKTGAEISAQINKTEFLETYLYNDIKYSLIDWYMSYTMVRKYAKGSKEYNILTQREVRHAVQLWLYIRRLKAEFGHIFIVSVDSEYLGLKYPDREEWFIKIDLESVRNGL